MFEFYPKNPHDHFVRRTFDVTAHACVLLKSRLSPGVLAALNLDTLTATKETFLGADEHENRLDLLYSVQQRSGEELLIYLLLEHKSGADRWIALQLLRYVVKIQQWRQRNGQSLCVVIPLVVYHGDEDWDEPLSLRDKVPAVDLLREFVPDMRAILVDLSRLPSEFLPEAPELEARIRTLQIVRRAELAFDAVVNIFRLLRSWQEIDAQMDAVNDIIIYLYAVFDARKLEWFEQAIRTGLQSESEKQMPTCLEAMIERGIEQGIEKGIEKGIDQGIETGLIVGRIRTLQEVLRQPITAEAELLALPVAELQQRAITLQALLPQS
jgi:predicted transposase/invertase (TIGR01784 family)